MSLTGAEISMATVLDQFDVRYGRENPGDDVPDNSAEQRSSLDASSSKAKSKGKSCKADRVSTSDSTCIPCWWKTIFGGKHLPDYWPHTDGKLYDHLTCEACEELSSWWEERKARSAGANLKYPRNCVLQLEKYFGGAHGCVRQMLIAWWRDRDGQGKLGSSKKAKLQAWRERINSGVQHSHHNEVASGEQINSQFSADDPCPRTPAGKAMTDISACTSSNTSVYEMGLDEQQQSSSTGLSDIVPAPGSSLDHDVNLLGQITPLSLNVGQESNCDGRDLEVPAKESVLTPSREIQTLTGTAGYGLNPKGSTPRASPVAKLPIWWKATFGGTHLPEIWPHADGKVYEKLDGEACEELSQWWEDRKETKTKGLQPKYPRDSVLQLEKYFGGSHGSLRQLVAAWRRDRDGQGKRGSANLAKVQFWRERMEISGHQTDNHTDLAGQTVGKSEDEVARTVTAVAVTPTAPYPTLVPVVLLDNSKSESTVSAVPNEKIRESPFFLPPRKAFMQLAAVKNDAECRYSCQLKPIPVDSEDLSKVSGGIAASATMPCAQAVLVDSGAISGGEKA